MKNLKSQVLHRPHVNVLSFCYVVSHTFILSCQHFVSGRTEPMNIVVFLNYNNPHGVA
jgi:hypothetical protein